MPAIIAAICLLILYLGQHYISYVGNPAATPAGVTKTRPPAPILIVTSRASTFSAYYPEILRTEGLNAFDVEDIEAVTGKMLERYDLVLLARMRLSVATARMFSDWVQRGGNLIAMAPGGELGALLGLSPTGKTLEDAYLLVDSATAAGRGIVNQTMQFHGRAERYSLDGASSLATLYETADSATGHPAVTWRQVGQSGGQAAAFAYDLATSIVLTRQGNPAWATQERDGFKPIRSNDKFFGGSPGNPQPDWVDPSKVAIPQADEQQRLLANLIVQMNLGKKPLPRFWYFPFGKRAVVIMTGDDHGNGGTARRFDQFIAASPAGCSLEKWECVRGTSYIFPDTPIVNPQAARYAARGFEIALHVNTGCRDYTPASLESDYREQLAVWQKKYRNLDAPRTQRHHCIVWSDWATGAKVQLAHGMRLDVSYYFWPSGWARNIPGIFTGSAMPMRFADLDGSVIDVYGTATQMTDESGQSYPYTVDTLLDRALGPLEYFGAYTVNAHTDKARSPVSDAVIRSARRRSVPVVSSRQMLAWLDGRNGSSFHTLAWSGNTLRFSIDAASGSTGLQAMLPLHTRTGVLTVITQGDRPVDFDIISAKGIEYAIFPATTGSYQAAYGPEDSTPPAVAATVPHDIATNVDPSTTVQITFSEPVDPETVSADTIELRNAEGRPVAARIAYDMPTHTATMSPIVPLQRSSRYQVTIKGGPTKRGIRDLAGNALASDARRSFSTGAGFLFPSITGVAQPHRRQIHIPDYPQPIYGGKFVSSNISEWKFMRDK